MPVTSVDDASLFYTARQQQHQRLQAIRVPIDSSCRISSCSGGGGGNGCGAGDSAPMAAIPRSLAVNCRFCRGNDVDDDVGVLCGARRGSNRRA
jgi:hypothetical protein